LITIYHNPRCQKSRQALKLIEDKGEMVQVVEYLKMPPSRETLKDLLNKLDLPVEAIIRKGEPVYKEHFKNKTMSTDAWLDALVKHPKLLERPIVVSGKRAVVGRPPEKVLEIL
jgi:arsenate reductase